MTADRPRRISSQELTDAMGAAGLRIVGVGPEAQWQQGHIPGASGIPFEALNRNEPPAAGLLPSATDLAGLLGAAGISNDTQVVIYDAEHGTKAGRLAFVLDALGHHQWSVLDGGLAAWVAAGGAIERGAAPVDAAEFRPGDGRQFIADRDYILGRLGAPDFLPVDTRSQAEFDGTDQRAARGGHIPGAVHFDWVEAVDPDAPPRQLAEAALQERLEARGITRDKELVLYCQTHHRSSHTYAALRMLGYDKVRGYPGAWSDWGNHPDTPIES